MTDVMHTGRELDGPGLEQLLAGLTAVRGGDFSTRLPETGDPLMDEIANVFNGMSDQLDLFTSEVTRVAREVGTEGKLGGQADIPDVSGTWKDLTDSVNAMAGNLTGQVRDVAEVATAVARGDLTQKITVDAKGEMLELKSTINTMVDQLSGFADEVTRVAREVGSDGILGGQAHVPGVAGTWRDLTLSVNFMAGNLTDQVRNIAQVTTAVAKGDLSQKITVDARGEILELKNTINTMVDQLSAFADEVTRVAREVGSDGILGGQAQAPGVAGTWRDLTDSVNSMARNLTGQVRSIAQVATAVAKGDLSQKITVDARGEILELKSTINTMVDQLSGFADEVTRVAREVGTEGRLGGQADVKGVSGTWKDLTESVNVMAANLTDQVRSIAEVTTSVARGDLTQKIRVDARGEILELKETINTMVDQLSAFADEVTRVAREVGTQGNLGGQAAVRGVSGTWKDLTDNVNVMASNLTAQVRSIAQVATAVARGDLSQQITVEAKGEVAALAQTINTMVGTLSAFAGEVTRVAREVGTEGILGGQATVPNVAGTWKDLTDNVNSMANNLTGQVRNIAQVTTAVAQGDLSKKIDVDARGEILELKTTINTMVDQLSAFAAEVTRVAREVGSEGRLGGQAEVEGVSGTWKRLTENVNELAGNLTRQVRAIAEVTSAVASGDLTRSISVEAQGEVAELKDNINAMVQSLRETIRANQQQDWLKTNLARLAGMMQGHRDLTVVAELIMDELTPMVGAQHGTFFLTETVDDEPRLRLIAGYGLRADKEAPLQYRLGQSLIGQAAKSKRSIVVSDVPEGYVKISSGDRRGGPSQPRGAPDPVPGPGARRHRAGLVHRLQPGADRLPRAADRDPRGQRQHDRRQLAHRRPAGRVAAAGRGAPGPFGGAAGPAGGASAVQRGARGQGGPAGPAEPGHRDEERRDRAGPAGNRGTRAAVRPGVEVQVPVPGQHVPRAAHPAQQPADPGPPARAEPRPQPQCQAGRVRQRHPLGGLGPAPAHQRHPGPVQGRGGADGHPPRAVRAEQPAGRRPRDLPAAHRGEGPELRGRAGARGAGRHVHRPAAAAPGPGEPAVERGQVHLGGVGRAPGRPGRAAGPRRRHGPGVLRDRYRHRHRAGEPADHLRGLPAG